MGLKGNIIRSAGDLENDSNVQHFFPWSEADLKLAESLRLTLLDVIFRLTSFAAGQQKGPYERHELLLAELNHRIRSIVELIQGMRSRSRLEPITIEEFLQLIARRIQSLDSAPGALSFMGFESGSLRRLVVSEINGVIDESADRVILHGADVQLEPRAYSTLCLVLHELAAHSAKAGALGKQDGQVDITWELTASGALAICWREKGEHAAELLGQKGFGATIVEKAIPFELNGAAEIICTEDGLEARFVIPQAYVNAGLPQDPIAERLGAVTQAASGPLAGTVLVVEDNMIIAFDVEEILRSLGARNVEVAASVSDALRQIEKQKPSYAFVDMNLGSETGLAVAERLAALEVPFAFMTGYSEGLRLPLRFQSIPLVNKPFTVDMLARAIERHVALRQ